MENTKDSEKIEFIQSALKIILNVQEIVGKRIQSITQLQSFVKEKENESVIKKTVDYKLLPTLEQLLKDRFIWNYISRFNLIFILLDRSANVRNQTATLIGNIGSVLSSNELTRFMSWLEQHINQSPSSELKLLYLKILYEVRTSLSSFQHCCHSL